MNQVHLSSSIQKISDEKHINNDRNWQAAGKKRRKAKPFSHLAPISFYTEKKLLIVRSSPMLTAQRARNSPDGP